ncbi:MAG: 16S rRNA (cytosine(1402)-N(4))-methyltransferase RsmH, partial [Flavobacteriales bacterium]
MSQRPDCYHIPVLLRSAVEGLSIEQDALIVDATFGGGGHSRAILDAMDGGRLIAFDKDADARSNVPNDDRLTLLHQDFRFLKLNLDYLGIHSVDGIIADLGISSHQIDVPERGFSIRFDTPLDLRMNTKKTKTAADLINESDAGGLIRILRNYGELREAERLARAIEKNKPISTTGSLVEAIRPLVPTARINQYAARVFQAL